MEDGSAAGRATAIRQADQERTFLRIVHRHRYLDVVGGPGKRQAEMLSCTLDGAGYRLLFT